MEWYVDALNKFCDFSGRSRRTAFWMFTLINTLITLAILLLEAFLSTPARVSSIYTIVMFIPWIAVAIRRYHDTGHSGWWIFLPLANLILLVINSQPGRNRYGENPKGR
ncbi:MAG: DUF805 domain-containing protein [Phormidesmis sp. RL_2_1]|nr:DUF805 domain-containing protein [Phormidesmis sp. RL_2_1]